MLLHICNYTGITAGRSCTVREGAVERDCLFKANLLNCSKAADRISSTETLYPEQAAFFVQDESTLNARFGNTSNTSTLNTVVQVLLQPEDGAGFEYVWHLAVQFPSCQRMELSLS